MQSTTCFACSAVVTGLSKCVACGAPQTEIARDAFEAVQKARAKTESWRLAAGILTLVAFVLGAFAGLWFGIGQQTANAPVDDPAPVVSSEARANGLLVEALNEAFQARELPMEIVGWAKTPEGVLSLIIAPPTRENPVVLWQALDERDRSGLMAFISVAYTQAMVASGYLLDGAHPPLELHYHGYATPLATRTAEGQIRIYPSPFDPRPSRALPQ